MSTNSLDAMLARRGVNQTVGEVIVAVHRELMEASGGLDLDEALHAAYNKGVTDMALTLAKRLAELEENGSI